MKREDNAEDDNIINQKSHVKSNLDNLTQEFDEFVRETFEANVKYGIYLPPNLKPAFDYFLDVTSGNFIEWNRLVPNAEALIKTTGKSDNIIETVDSIRFTFLSTLMVQGNNSVLITGGQINTFFGKLVYLTLLYLNINKLKKVLPASAKPCRFKIC